MHATLRLVQCLCTCVHLPSMRQQRFTICVIMCCALKDSSSKMHNRAMNMLCLCSAPLNISSGSRNIKSGHRSHSKSERRSPQSVLQGDNERLKAELQRVHNDIAEQLKDLQV